MTPVKTWWRLLKVQPRLSAASHAFYLCYTLSLAFSGLILRAFFDHLGDEPGAQALAIIVLLQIGNSLLAIVGLGGANAIAFYPFRHTIRALLFHNIFTHVLAQPGARSLPVHEATGEQMSVGVALNTLRDDVDQIFDFDIEIGDLFGFGLAAVVAFVVMFQISVPITLGVFAPLIAIIVITDRLRPRIERFRAVSREATGQATSAIGEIFGAVQAIQANNAEDRIMLHFHRLNETRRRAGLRDQLLTRLVEAFADNLVVIGTALVLILAARGMLSGSFSVGDLALFIAYIWPVTVLFRNIGSLVAILLQTGVSIARLQALMQGAPEEQLTTHVAVPLTGPLPPLPPPVPPRAEPLVLLEARGLTYHHPSSGLGIEGIDLRVERGTLTVVTGPIGAGKTTLLRVLLGLLPKDEGEIFWNGQLVDAPDSFFVPPRVAYTPQTPHLFSASLRDNILLGVEVDERRLQRAIERAVLAADVAGMKEGLDTRIGPRGLRLSGGQIQRTAAARMFVRNPELLVFDDLTSALDAETERQLWEQLFPSLANSSVSREETTLPPATCLVVSHRPGLIRRADQVVTLRDGLPDRIR